MTKESDSSVNGVGLCVKLDTELETNEFMRGVYINLTKDKNTPTDILTSEFKFVSKSDVEHLFVKGNVDLSYTCEIGIDRKEEYLDKETYYDNGVKREKVVKKTRTVTDWQALSGTNKSQESCIVVNGKADIADCSKNDDYASLAIRHRVKGNETVLHSSDYSADPNAIGNAKQLMLGKCFRRVKLPGDHHKNESYSGSVAIEQEEIYVLPEYSVNYSYKGKEYTAKSYACTDSPSCRYTAPSEVCNIEASVNGKVKKITRPLFWGGIGAIVLFFIIALINGLSKTESAALKVFMSLGYVLMVLAVAAILTSFLIVGKLKTKYNNELVNGRQAIKMQALIKFLSEKGMRELSDSEKASV